MKRRIFTRGAEAVKEAVKFVKACLELGGIPHLRHKYAGIPFRVDNKRGVMLVCYGRAEYLPNETVYAPETDPEWKDFVETVESYTGDYKIIIEEYGPRVSREEVEEFLRELGLTPEKVERIRKMPIYARAVTA